MTVTYHLEEKKEKLTYNGVKVSYLIHQRSIKTDCEYEPDRSYRVEETFYEGEAVWIERCFFSDRNQGFDRGSDSRLSDSERMAIEKFEQDWSNLWNPQAILELD